MGRNSCFGFRPFSCFEFRAFRTAHDRPREVVQRLGFSGQPIRSLLAFHLFARPHRLGRRSQFEGQLLKPGVSGHISIVFRLSPHLCISHGRVAEGRIGNFPDGFCSGQLTKGECPPNDFLCADARRRSRYARQEGRSPRQELVHVTAHFGRS